jgi:4-amino-4-deoxy-L-arabinose transferase-like glycosyltransferase
MMSIILQPAKLVRYSLRRIDRAHERVFQNRHLLLFMLSLQLFWLATIAWTGASTSWSVLSFVAIYSILAGMVVILLPATLILKLHDFQKRVLQKENRVILALCLFALIVGSFYATQHRPWSDEGRSFKTAKTLAAVGLESSYMIHGWLRTKHPPLVPLTNGLTLNLLGENLLYLRFISVLFLVATLPAVYLLGRELYDRETGYLAALLFLSFPLVIRLGSSAMMDMQLAFFFTLSLLLGRHLLRSPSYRLATVLGLVIGLGLLTKYIMIFVYGALLGFAFFKPDLRKLKYHLATAILISMAMLALWLFYLYHLGLLSAQIQKIVDYTGIFHVINVGEMNTQPSPALVDVPEPATDSSPALAGDSVLQPGSEIPEGRKALPRYNVLAGNRIFQLGLETLSTRLPSALGVHHLPLILFGVLFLLRRQKPADLFILFWIGILFFALFLTLPDHRYFLSTFPAIAILIARSFTPFPGGKERALLLCLLFNAGNLYLFVNWVREANLFLPL